MRRSLTLKSWHLSILHSAIALYCLIVVSQYLVWWQIGTCSLSFALCLYYVVSEWKRDRWFTTFKRRQQALEQIEAEFGKIPPYEVLQVLEGVISPDHLRKVMSDRMGNLN